MTRNIVQGDALPRKKDTLFILVVGAMFVMGLLVAGASFYLVLADDSGDPYEPLNVPAFTVLNTEPIGPRGQVILQDGVCNKTKEPIAAKVILGAQRERTALISERVVIFEADKVFAPGCIATDAPLEGPLPASITPGEWRFFLDIEVDAGSDRIQKINLLSNVFRVTAE